MCAEFFGYTAAPRTLASRQRCRSSASTADKSFVCLITGAMIADDSKNIIGRFLPSIGAPEWRDRTTRPWHDSGAGVRKTRLKRHELRRERRNTKRHQNTGEKSPGSSRPRPRKVEPRQGPVIIDRCSIVNVCCFVQTIKESKINLLTVSTDSCSKFTRSPVNVYFSIPGFVVFTPGDGTIRMRIVGAEIACLDPCGEVTA